MNITVRLFATVRQNAGWAQKEFDLADGATVATLLNQLASEYPDLDIHERSLYAAVNQEYAQPERVLKDGETVALFPPVSGGN